MSLLSRIFRNGRLKFESKQQQSSDDVFQPQLAEHQFDKENIRFIIFRDHDLKGRSVLFDSLRDGATDEPKVSRSSSDLKKLAEMMFGTLPLSHKTTTFKVHSTKSPPQLMITKVFIPQPRSRESTMELDSFDLYSIESLSADDNIHTEAVEIPSQPCPQPGREIAHSMPLEVPLRMFGGPSFYLADDMELSTSASGIHGATVPSSGSATCLCGSYSSKDRRMRRYKNTMIEHLLTSSLNDDKPDPVPLHMRPTKIGIAIIFMLPDENSPINRCFQSFFFCHIMLIENYVHQLKDAIDQALAKRSRELIWQAIKVFVEAMSSLYKAPRLKDPAWLSMMTYKTRRLALSSRLLKDFTMLVEKCHTKNTKFFLGVLITAVLTHHLSWAPTVAPVEEKPSQTYLDKHAAKWVNALVQSHPYNPLWVQLGDLYGAIGVPLCLSRTVVVGRKSELVRTILFFLSYFIRCSEILENIDEFPNLGADSHSCCSSETSSLAPDDEITLQSPVPDSNGMTDSANSATTVEQTFKELPVVSSTPDFQCCPDNSDCCAEVRPLMLYVKPSGDLLNQVPLVSSDASVPENDATATNSGMITSGSESGAEQSVNSNIVKKKKPQFSLKIDSPCRMMEERIIESPKREDIRKVGLAAGDIDYGKKLHRVPLSGKSVHDDDSSIARNHSEIHQHVKLTRGISMFDEYFDNGIDLEFPLKDDKDVYNIRNLEDILDVPCPDVSQFNIDHLTKTNSTCDTGVDLDESQLDSEHFGEIDLENVVVGLTDEPRKQILHSVISMLQDQYTERVFSGLTLDGNRLCMNGDNKHDRLDRSSSRTKSRKKRHASGQSLNMASSRCRSVTLSESSHSKNNMTDYLPVPMPSSAETPMTDFGRGCIYLSEECNFGRSLLGDYCPCYTSHFVLHGTGDRKFLQEPYVLLHQDLRTSVQNSVLDEPVAESTCIIADTDNWNVQLFSCKSKSPDEPLKPLPLISSQLVCNLIESVYELAKLKMSPEFCLLHLEDQLQSIYLKSQRLAEYIKVCRTVYSSEMAALLSLDISDMPLLLAVARIHSPQLFRNR